MKLMRIITIAIIAASIGGGIYIAKPQSLRPHPKEVHLKNVRQLTFGGDNAEAYWAFGGDRLILQSNHKPYKCDQIEILSTQGGTPKLVSTGKGRTTCAYFLKGDRE